MDIISNYSTELKKEGVQNIFLSQKEYDFAIKIGAEYLQKANGQYVYYIKIDRQKTKANIYGESKQKLVSGEPIKVPCMVSEIAVPVNDGFGVRFDKQLRVAFLDPLNKVYGVEDVVMGDYVEWQQKRYEILNIERHRKMFGQQDWTFEIIATCKARE